MKIFDFTDGKKGRELANIRVMHGCGGWFVRKPGSDKVYKVTLAKAYDPSREGVRWTWHSSADTGIDAKEIRAEDFGVGAICFCSGQMTKPHEEWHWHVIGTCEWNKQACRDGILESEFSHLNTADDRAKEAARVFNSMKDQDIHELCERFETRQGLVEKYIATGIDLWYEDLHEDSYERKMTS